MRERAIGLLARREHSRRELARKLASRRRRGGADADADAEVDAERIDAIVDALAQEGLQSDERCAEMLVHARIERGHGPLRIRADLREAGIDADVAEPLLEAEADGWVERLLDLVNRRFGGEPPADAREWARRARFLAGRGFPEAMVRDVLGERPH